jgi:hypothetical protein
VGKAGHLLVLAGFIGFASSAALGQASVPPESMVTADKPNSLAKPRCNSDDPGTVVVCGRSQRRYRIDPLVLEATRTSEAPPPKPQLDATTAKACTGPNCGGGVIPLVGMALTAVKAAVLASQGDDWREAFRTRPDQYRAYEDAKARTSRISIGVVVGNGRQ